MGDTDRYIALGLPLFPLAPKSKVPAIKGGNGFHDATTDCDTIAQWQWEYPDMNVGCAPPPGYVVIDIDDDTEFMELVAEHGKLPTTWVARTGSGGWHYWFKTSVTEFRGQLCKGVDIKHGGGGYVVMPGSIHPNGEPYEWVTFDGIDEPAQAPAWLEERMRKVKPPAPTGQTHSVTASPGENSKYVDTGIRMELDILRQAPDGNRNNQLNESALKLATLPVEREWLRQCLIDACSDNGYLASDGLAKINATINSAFKKADQNGPRTIPARNSYGDAFQIDPEEAAEFWSARPVLQHIQVYARSRAAGPWGALASTLVRAQCAVPAHITLPPTVGGRMSLNLFVAMVGSSGLGKNAADAVAREGVRFSYAKEPKDPVELPIGTGEGIAKSFRQSDEDDDRPAEVIFTAAEIDTLSVLSNRQGATIDAEIRKLYSGETLGFTNAGRETRTRVGAHSYRAGLIVGAQPLRCSALLDAADGGTPQRFLWMPVGDPDAPEVLPATPAPLKIDIPALLVPGGIGTDLVIPSSVRDEILAHRRAMLRGESVDPLNGHRLLSRLKVSAALMVLDSTDPDRDRGVITEQDWDLAGVVMTVSDNTRAMVQAAARERARSNNRARAEDAADREIIKVARLDHSHEERCKRAILSKLQREGRCKRITLYKVCKASIRGSFDAALDALVSAGSVVRIAEGGGRADEYEIA